MDKKDYRAICEALVVAYMTKHGCREVVARGMVGEIIEKHMGSIVEATLATAPVLS
jgi:hypothetical protein